MASVPSRPATTPLSATCPSAIPRALLRNRWADLGSSIGSNVGAPTEPTDLDVFLTARWGTVAMSRGRLRHHPVDHPPWVLLEASVVELDDSAVTAAGLRTPSGTPVVRAAESLDARFGRPVRV